MMLEQEPMAEEPKRSSIGALSGQDVPPKLQREIDVMRTATIKLLHDKKTQGSVVQMLQAGEISQSLPATALQVNDMLEKSMKPEVDVVLANSVTLVSDLFEIADAAGIAPMPEEKVIVGVYQDTLQKYIQKGLKDGSIDPVELQASIEPLMSEEQRTAGKQMGTEAGLPEEATSDMATQKLVQQATNTERAKVKPQAQPQQGMLQGGQR